MAQRAIETQTLVDVQWLKDHLDAPDVRVIDATWRPSGDINARAAYEERHIPGAVFFDVDEIVDERSSLPNTLPPLEKFVSRVRKLGVGDGHRIVVYDQNGMFSSPRVWWMFRYFGHTEVSVLDGGLPAWIAADGPLEDLPPTPRDRHFTPQLRSMLLSDVTKVSEALKVGAAQIVDARSPERFSGAEGEPREGMRAGHMPGALNAHYQTLLQEDGRLKSDDALRAALEAAGVDLAKPIITTCGSGVSAAILSLALTRLGHDAHSLYDGSWAEWGSSPMLPVETG
ncbi:MAG: 3-mercaptopyruvate sulfurtransferase [Pseudomonadota bacterium]